MICLEVDGMKRVLFKVILPLAFILSRLFQAAGVWHAFWITEFVSAVISWIICKKEIFQ